MNLGLSSAMSVHVTVISNEFIDTYMAAANGEYVKVFLYLQRHEGEHVTVSAIADALNHTEADVKRALSYWKDAGVLMEKADPQQHSKEMLEKAGRQQDRSVTEMAATVQPEEETGSKLLSVPEPGNSFERRQKLSADEDFKALTYVVQQYLGKMLTSMEMEMFEYLYDDLKMSSELLEFLVEYCAGTGHKSIRYIEKVALNWYQMGIKTREEAKDYTIRFSRDTSAVMKAFGITNRNPGTAEQEYMKKWFKEYGFDAELVKEACSRTLTATGSASFPYADKILAGWKENGVRTLRDVQELDKRRQMTKAQQEKKPGNVQGGNRSGQKQGGSGNNRFKNFEERSYDYENLVWEGMRKRQKGGSGDGTQ
ncbi:MAG: DnaD domain protein [Lachnospiraceae bacterium]|nr:DnaD domain protein [Lachnospiraceae bacterium]